MYPGLGLQQTHAGLWTLLLAACVDPSAGVAFVQAPAGRAALSTLRIGACPLAAQPRAGRFAGGALSRAECRSAPLDRRSLLVSGGVAILGSGLALPARADVLSGTSVPLVPELAINQLDQEAAAAIDQEMRALADQGVHDDTVFTFRGGLLSRTSSEGALTYLARRNAVFFGETHDSSDDKKLAVRIIRQLERRRGKVVVGMEMVQQPFQNVLDWYVFKATPSKGSDKVLFEKTEWATRWGWEFESYLPVLHYCQQQKIRVLALNVEAEVTARVRNKGLVALSKEERKRLVLDADGFLADCLAPSFPEYADSVLRPSFDAHLKMGMFQDDTASFQKFVENRILWDETMASAAARYLYRNPETLMLGLVGGDHVKTGHGIPARIERILENLGYDNARTASVALNPSWKLYSNSKKLVALDKVESKSSLLSRGSLLPAKVAREEGWGGPPPATHHPFSDIVWFS